MKISKPSKINTSKVNIRFLVNETLHKGSHIDRKIDGSNTLLHLAVEYDLLDCVLKLLSSGANSNTLNANGHSPHDIALNNGNQILLQVLGRREDYGKHLKFLEPSSDERSTSKPNIAHKELTVNVSTEFDNDAKVLLFRIGAVYEDYLDWSDSKRCQRLKELGEALKLEELVLNKEIFALCDRKTKTIANLVHIHNKLRDKEHRHCLKVWEMTQLERSCRRDLARISEDVSHLKASLEESECRVHWRGSVRVRRRGTVGGLFAGWGGGQWLDCGAVITGKGISFDGDVPVHDHKARRIDTIDRAADLSPGTPSFLSLSSGPVRRQIQRGLASTPSVAEHSEGSTLSWESVLRVEIGPGDQTIRRGLCVLEVDVTYVGEDKGSRGASPVRTTEGASPSFGRDEVLSLRFVSGAQDVVAGAISSSSSGKYSADLQEVLRVLRLLGCNVRSDSTSYSDDDDEVGGGTAQSLSSHFAQEFLGEKTRPSESRLSVAIPATRHRATFSNSNERSPRARDSSSGLTSVESLLGGGGGALGRGAGSFASSSYSTRPSLGSGHTVQTIGECADAFSDIPLSSSVPREDVASHIYESGDSLINSATASSSHQQRGSFLSSTTPISISSAATRESFSLQGGKMRLSHEWERSPEVLRGEGNSRRKRRSADGSRGADFGLGIGGSEVFNSLPPVRRASTCAGKGRRHERSSLSEQLHCDLLSENGSFDSSSPRASHDRRFKDVRSLRRLLDASRVERDCLQHRLVEVITSREKLLEKFHFLQALRAVVDDPPRAPTRTLCSAKTPSVERAMAMLAVYREHVDSGRATPVVLTTTSSGPPTQTLELLSEAEDFVKIMLRADEHAALNPLCSDSEGEGGLIYAMDRSSSGDSGGMSMSQSQSRSESRTVSMTRPEQTLAYGSNVRECDVSMSMESGGIMAAGFRSPTPSVSCSSRGSSWRHQRDERSPFVDALVEAARSPGVMSPVTSSLGAPPTTPPSGRLVQRQQDPDSSSTSLRMTQSVHCPSGGIRISPWKFFSQKGQHQQGTRFNAASTAVRPAASVQIFGAPPTEFQVDFDEVMRQLEEVWNCELESYEAAGRLTQCLVLREQTYSRLSKLKIQERALVVPQQEVLYDVEL